MAGTQIINNGASLKITSADGTRNILKQRVQEISLINDTTVKIDVGQGALNNIFVDFADVTEPKMDSAALLVDAINNMMQSSIAGVATEQNQQKEISDLDSIKSSLQFQAPQISDEANPQTIYRGFSVPGAKTSDPTWAILKISNSKGIYSYQWAGGNQNFDKVWDNRKTLIYS